MNNIAKVLITAGLTIAAGTTANAQALHVLIACDTEDASIGNGVKANMEHLSKLTQEVIGVLECESTVTAFAAPDCTKTNVTNWIKNLELEPDDTVLFIYSGHGGRALNDNDPFPQMCMNNPSNQAGFLPIAHVDKMLESKNPRLRIIITECCNSEDPGIKSKPYYAMAAGNYTMASDYDAKALRDLFFNTEGKVIITSSKAKEYSWICTGGAGIGGYFVNNFIDTFNDATKNRTISADWNTIFQDVHDKVSALEFHDNNGIRYTQEPYAVISKKKNSDKDVDKKRNYQTGTLFESLQYLVNPSTDVNVRLNKIPEILNRHFTNGAKVLNVAANGNTIVDRENAEDFLRRITLSHNIKQICVLSGSNDEPNSVIKIHELRK